MRTLLHGGATTPQRAGCAALLASACLRLLYDLLEGPQVRRSMGRTRLAEASAAPQQSARHLALEGVNTHKQQPCTSKCRPWAQQRSRSPSVWQYSDLDNGSTADSRG